MGGYERYLAWCKVHNQTPPSREWWDWACSRKAYFAPQSELMREVLADQREIDRERREGWAYD